MRSITDTELRDILRCFTNMHLRWFNSTKGKDCLMDMTDEKLNEEYNDFFKTCKSLYIDQYNIIDKAPIYQTSNDVIMHYIHYYSVRFLDYVDETKKEVEKEKKESKKETVDKYEFEEFNFEDVTYVRDANGKVYAVETSEDEIEIDIDNIVGVWVNGEVLLFSKYKSIQTELQNAEKEKRKYKSLCNKLTKKNKKLRTTVSK